MAPLKIYFYHSRAILDGGIDTGCVDLCFNNSLFNCFELFSLEKKTQWFFKGSFVRFDLQWYKCTSDIVKHKFLFLNKTHYTIHVWT